MSRSTAGLLAGPIAWGIIHNPRHALCRLFEKGIGRQNPVITRDTSADRILLMTNGPFARVAESVEITVPRPRDRTSIVEHPNYYAIRNHLVQFLGKRSKELAGKASGGETQSPEPVRIDLTAPATDPQPDQPVRLHAFNS